MGKKLKQQTRTSFNIIKKRGEKDKKIKKKRKRENKRFFLYLPSKLGLLSFAC